MMADAFRILVGASTAYTLCLTVLIISYYVVIMRMGHHGLLTRHVALVAISYLILVVYAGADAIVRLDTKMTWRLPLVIAAMILGMPALMMVLTHVTERYDELKRKGEK